MCFIPHCKNTIEPSRNYGLFQSGTTVENLRLCIEQHLVTICQQLTDDSMPFPGLRTWIALHGICWQTARSTNVAQKRYKILILCFLASGGLRHVRTAAEICFSMRIQRRTGGSAFNVKLICEISSPTPFELITWLCEWYAGRHSTTICESSALAAAPVYEDWSPALFIHWPTTLLTRFWKEGSTRTGMQNWELHTCTYLIKAANAWNAIGEITSCR